ncbi:hypothetical protein CMI47_06515 [Candidatus Pacearchaeota archaeon]|nr:hypothetical protein [Candidatus Pacearchaeota archaeon]|tara:strand:- start:230 stop:652 length:423 start_codon:yes stop_codon:yes gene_type:complete
MRVHELAKEFDIKSTEFVDIVQSFGIDIKSHLSGLDDAQVSDIRHKMKIKEEFSNDEEIAELNPLGNLTQEEADEIIGGVESIASVKEGETVDEFNARRREEQKNAEAADVARRLEEVRQEQRIKLDKAGFWGWLKGLFS